MAFSEDYLVSEDLHPIDIVETLAEHHAWEFDRVADDQIAMAIPGGYAVGAAGQVPFEEPETAAVSNATAFANPTRGRCVSGDVGPVSDAWGCCLTSCGCSWNDRFGPP